MSDSQRTIQFTKSGDVWVAYQVIGDGPVDVIFSIGWLSNFHGYLKHPASATFFRKLAERCRLILFDKRGTGMSDRDVGIATLEDRADDIRAILDAVGSHSCTVIGQSEGANIAAMFAATYPERTRSLILMSCTPCVAWKPDWQQGLRRAEFERYKSDLVENWGAPTDLSSLAPSIANDPRERALWQEMLMYSASPKSAEAMAQMWYQMDIRDILPTIHIPSLVLHRRDEKAIPLENAREVAELMPQGRLVELDGVDHIPWFGDTDSIINEIHQFLGQDQIAKPIEDRRLMTILSTDVVGSSFHSREMGDSAWLNWTKKHFGECRMLAAEHGGKLVKTMGDGALLAFSGPSAATECALSIQETLSDNTITLRMGIHTGECIIVGDDLSGVAINLAVRIMEVAEGGQVLVSSMVKDLSFGSKIEFAAHSPRELKGFDDEWVLFEAT